MGGDEFNAVDEDTFADCLLEAIDAKAGVFDEPDELLSSQPVRQECRGGRLCEFILPSDYIVTKIVEEFTVGRLPVLRHRSSHWQQRNDQD